MDPRREFVLPSAGVGQPWQFVFVGRCAKVSTLLPLANVPKRKAGRTAPYNTAGNGHKSPCLLSGCSGALSVRLRSSAASSSQYAIDACPQHDGA